MDELKKIIELSKCGAILQINNHRVYYQTADRALEDLDKSECPPEILPEIRAKMIETDTIIYVCLYPLTPIGSCDFYHYDLELVLKEALDYLTATP